MTAMARLRLPCLDVISKKMQRLVNFVFAIILGLSAVDSYAQEPDVKTCLPWTDRAGIAIGMDRNSFEELLPSAKFASIDGYPEDPRVAVTGPYIEGNPQERDQPFWSYYVTRDKLSSVTWAVASRAAKDQHIVDELAKIRVSLIKAHGEPTVESGLRLSRGTYSKIRQEVFRPKDSKTAIILTATSSASGSEIGAHIFTSSEISRLSYETMITKIDLTKFKEDESGASVVDLLESLAAKASAKSE